MAKHLELRVTGKLKDFDGLSKGRVILLPEYIARPYAYGGCSIVTELRKILQRPEVPEGPGSGAISQRRALANIMCAYLPRFHNRHPASLALSKNPVRSIFVVSGTTYCGLYSTVSSFA